MMLSHTKILAVPVCGMVPSRIIGGSAVTPYSLPWHVGLVASGSDIPFCGGTLIGPNHVLTAGHCIMGRQIEVIVGEHELYNKEDETRHEVCSKILHPNFNKETSLNYDFAILRLKTPVKLGPRAVPACLPGSNLEANALVGKNVVASGWGRLSEGGNQSSILHSASLPVITPNQCKEAYGSTSVTDAMICAGNLNYGGVDACEGDSGGEFMSVDRE